MKTSTGRPPTATVPASGRCRPERIDISVDLPAPFSPITAVTTPVADVDRHVVERHDAREVLAEPGDADRRAQRSVGHPSGVTEPALSALTTSGGISTLTGSVPSVTRSRSWVIDVTTWPTGSWLIEKAIVPSSMYVSVC